ncbi:MAG: DNA sulfur modification protein DndB [Acidobacteriota bacterium]|nr:DNA sulfur modification protein DndB [Acidobacteriota bacterium]
MNLKLGISSSLNLEISGSIGSFKVGKGQGDQSSIEVKYFLTHIGLDFDTGSNAPILSHLAPVREIFDPETLEFDEIMQRDIDDARVSSELIPYLLDSRSRDLVKLFPPIVVVVLPVKQDDNRPDDKYPKVEEFDQASADEDHKVYVVRAGAVGQEVFQFEQPIAGGKKFDHDMARLKLNTQRCKLVIVDGQHRAMALLALYRNLKQEWTNIRQAPFKDYYEEWTPNYIHQFQLQQISLPVMFCTFPGLDADYTGDYDLKKAARAIFLTLNKTARKVSESRNRLLDDNDLVALFLRDTLSSVKSKDVRSNYSLRIFNVELDQIHDRNKIESPIAITGVNHIYYLIEHLLVNKPEDVNGAKPRSGKLFNRTDIGSSGLSRLDGSNVLGAETAYVTKRNFYSAETGRKLADQFQVRMGRFIVTALEQFIPFEAHTKSVLWLEEQLRQHENQKLRPILFEGQGIGRVFTAHRENLREKLRKGDFGDEATKIEEIAKRLDATDKLINGFTEKLNAHRAEVFLSQVTDKSKLRGSDGNYHPKIVGFINDLYSNVFTTIAFQTALIAGFYGELERANAERSKSSQPPLETEVLFDDYLSALNSFFTPQSSSQFKRLVDLFAGSLQGDINEWKLAPSRYTFREVVYPGEMQPDQWPKYKYLFLEIWRPDAEMIKDKVAGERDLCRNQIFTSLHEAYRKDYLQDKLKREEDLTSEERKQILDDTYEAFKAFLQTLNWRVTEIPSSKTMSERISQPIDNAEAATETSEETWVSVEP